MTTVHIDLGQLSCVFRDHESGASYTIPGTGLRLGVQGSNLLNKAAFNDIAARNGESIADVTKVSPYNIIKTVLPRNLLFSVGYRF